MMFLVIISISGSCNDSYDEFNKLVEYPYPSPNSSVDAECSWTITVPVDRFVTLAFIDFEIEASVDCERSSLQIFDGENVNSPRMGGKLCGSSLPEDIESSGRSLFLAFSSSNVTNRTDEFRIGYDFTGKSRRRILFWTNILRI